MLRRYPQEGRPENRAGRDGSAVPQNKIVAQSAVFGVFARGDCPGGLTERGGMEQEYRAYLDAIRARLRKLLPPGDMFTVENFTFDEGGLPEVRVEPGNKAAVKRILQGMRVKIESLQTFEHMIQRKKYEKAIKRLRAAFPDMHFKFETNGGRPCFAVQGEFVDQVRLHLDSAGIENAVVRPLTQEEYFAVAKDNLTTAA